jgi:hypothetical protein
MRPELWWETFEAADAHKATMHIDGPHITVAGFAGSFYADFAYRDWKVMKAPAKMIPDTDKAVFVTEGH